MRERSRSAAERRQVEWYALRRESHIASALRSRSATTGRCDPMPSTSDRLFAFDHARAGRLHDRETARAEGPCLQAAVARRQEARGRPLRRGGAQGAQGTRPTAGHHCPGFAGPSHKRLAREARTPAPSVRGASSTWRGCATGLRIAPTRGSERTAGSGTGIPGGQTLTRSGAIALALPAPGTQRQLTSAARDTACPGAVTRDSGDATQIRKRVEVRIHVAALATSVIRTVCRDPPMARSGGRFRPGDDGGSDRPRLFRAKTVAQRGSGPRAYAR